MDFSKAQAAIWDWYVCFGSHEIHTRYIYEGVWMRDVYRDGIHVYHERYIRR
jgi:hypothetical protein